jgi:hypothetical protein
VIVQLDHPTMLAVRARRLLVRPLARRALAAAVAAATGVTVVSQVRTADAARRRWSDTRPVAVAQRDLRTGERLAPGDAEVRELPSAAVADAALTEPPVGVVVRQPIAAGEPLVAERLGAEGLTGVAALLPDGHRAVAIPTGPAGVPPVTIGDTVDVLTLAPFPTDLPTPGDPGSSDLDGHTEGIAPGDSGVDPVAPPPGAGDPALDTEDVTAGAGGSEDAVGEAAAAATPVQVLVERALVVATDDQEVTIAVPETDAPEVAYAALQGTLVITLTAP